MARWVFDFFDNVFRIEIPTETVTEIKEGGRRIESEKKVFPGYVLVRMDLDDRSWAAVRNTPGLNRDDGALLVLRLGVERLEPEAGKVKVLVSIFGRETPVELSFDQVARI